MARTEGGKEGGREGGREGRKEAGTADQPGVGCFSSAAISREKAVDIRSSAATQQRVRFGCRKTAHWLTSPLRAGAAATAEVPVAAATTQPQQAALPTSPLMVMSSFFVLQAGLVSYVCFRLQAKQDQFRLFMSQAKLGPAPQDCRVSPDSGLHTRSVCLSLSLSPAFGVPSQLCVGCGNPVGWLRDA